MIWELSVADAFGTESLHPIQHVELSPGKIKLEKW